MEDELRIMWQHGSGFPSGWRLDFVTRWLYKRQGDNRPSNDRGDMDWTRYAEVLQDLEASEPRIKYKRKR